MDILTKIDRYNRQMSSVVPENNRQRMKPWLEAKINGGKVPGLEWLDREQRIFKVPWKRLGNREWNEKDAEIFKEWAIHTGRFRENIDNPDFPTWKTRFRCALTKLPDIKELKDQNKLDGNTDEPYRVYQFLERRPSRSPTMPTHETMDRLDDFKYDTMSQQTIIPTTVNSGGSLDRSLASDLNSIASGDLIHCDSREINVIRENESQHGPMGQSSLDVIQPCKQEDFNFGDTDPTQRVQKEYSENQLLRQSPHIDPTDTKIYVTVRYKQEVKVDNLFTSSGGIRIFYDKQIPIPDICSDDVYGPTHDVTMVRLPDCGTQNVKQQQLTYQLLNYLDRGLHIKMENGNIIATRLCRCSIFVSSQSLNNGETTKLNRGQPTLIYDVYNYFGVAFDRFLRGQGPKPSAEVVIGFGQRFDLATESVTGMLISAVVFHVEANNLLTTITCSSPVSPNLEISKSDSYDRYIDNMVKCSTNMESMEF